MGDSEEGEVMSEANLIARGGQRAQKPQNVSRDILNLRSCYKR